MITPIEKNFFLLNFSVLFPLLMQRPQKWARGKVALNQLEQMKHSVKFWGYFPLFELLSLHLGGENDCMNLLKYHFSTRFQNRKTSRYLTWGNEKSWDFEQKFTKISLISLFSDISSRVHVIIHGTFCNLCQYYHFLYWHKGQFGASCVFSKCINWLNLTLLGN